MLPCSMVPASVTWGNCHTNNDSMAYADRIVICASSQRCNPRSSTYYSWSPNEAHPQIVTHDVNSSFIATNYDFKNIRPGRYQAYYALYNTTIEEGTPAAEDIITVQIDGFAFQFETMGGAIEMFAYAIAMFVVIGVFALIAIFYYQYADFDHEEGSTATAKAPNSSAVSPADKDELLVEKKI
uniref:Signal sequence receptor subunit alpha n=1 Tax=Parascaris equorum TaxID=6256 RepID=A0A914RCA1_PAREQ